ncbi:MAG TPA: glycosyltransferase family 9 protein [Gemmatimonadaceae bacterium]
MNLKPLELAWRRLWIRAITARLPRRARGTPDWSARPHKVLFLRHDRLGDMILTTGALRAIKASHPTITLHVLASPLNAPLLAHDPAVDRVLVFDRKRLGRYLATMRQLRRERYDAVVDCMVTAPSLTTLLLMLATGAPHRIGAAGRGDDRAVTIAVPRPPWAVHMADKLAALAAAFGVDVARADRAPRLVITDEERRQADATWRRFGEGRGRRMLVNISAGLAFRRWPAERFVGVIRRALQRDPALRVIVIAAPAEAALGEQVAGDTRSGRVAFRRTAGIRDAIALVATADLVFTPDTSIAHAATAFARPSVVLYVSDTAREWGRYGNPGRDLASTDRTLASLPLDLALAAIDELVDLVAHGPLVAPAPPDPFLEQ